MDRFWERMFRRLYEFPGFVLSENDECMLYNGGSRTTEGYGRMRYTVPGENVERETSAHRMAKMVEMRDLNAGNELDASHLCHNKICVRPEHIHFENTLINNARRACVNRGQCSRHPSRNGEFFPDCMLMLRRGRLYYTCVCICSWQTS